MLNIFARSSVARVTDPIGAWLLARGVTPDAVTVVGTVGTVASALWFFPRGQLFAGTMAVTFFVLFDLLDGAVARARRRGTPVGTGLGAPGAPAPGPRATAPPSRTNSTKNVTAMVPANS